jgi:hypothetical protein
MFNKIKKWWNNAEIDKLDKDIESITNDTPATPKAYIEHRPVAGIYVAKWIVYGITSPIYDNSYFISHNGYARREENQHTSFKTKEEAMLAIAKFKERQYGIGVTRTEIK